MNNNKKNEHSLRIYHILGHKSSLKNFKRTDYQSLFFNHNEIKLDVKIEGNLRNSQIYKIKNTFQNKNWVKKS